MDLEKLSTYTRVLQVLHHDLCTHQTTLDSLLLRTWLTWCVIILTTRPSSSTSSVHCSRCYCLWVIPSSLSSWSLCIISWRTSIYVPWTTSCSGSRIMLLDLCEDQLWHNRILLLMFLPWSSHTWLKIPFQPSWVQWTPCSSFPTCFFSSGELNSPHFCFQPFHRTNSASNFVSCFCGVIWITQTRSLASTVGRLDLPWSVTGASTIATTSRTIIKRESSITLSKLFLKSLFLHIFL